MNYQLLNDILMGDINNIEEIEELLNINDSKFFKILISTYLNSLNDELESKKFFSNITNCLISIVDKNSEIDYKTSLEYVKKIINKLHKKLKQNPNNSFYIYQLDEILYIQEKLIEDKYNKNSDTNNKYDFLIKVINEIQNVGILNNIINRYPHYVNLKNEENIHIVVDMFKYLEELLKNNISTNKIIHYEKLIEVFLDNERIKLSNKDIKLIEKQLNNIDIILNRNYSFQSKHKQLLTCIEILKMKSVESSISQRNLKLLEEKYQIDIGFSKDVVDEVNIILNKYKSDVSPIISIDSEDTTCIDDAFQIQKKDNNYELKIFISDVASQIPMNSKLDKEASNKFSNIYLPNSVITMLPSELSNNIFSLNTTGRKKVIEYNILFNSSGDIIDYKIKNSIIHIDNNLNYSSANKIINKNDYKNNDIHYSLSLLFEIANLLKSKNSEKQKYRIASDIIKTIDGKDLYKNEYANRTNSEVIVEELMILTNYISAITCMNKNYPYIYRINEKMENTEQYKKIIELAKDKNIENLNSLLSGYAKSKYSKEPKKHEGLNLDVYSHSSAPLRRYPDIVNQRILNDLIINKNNNTCDFWNKYIEENIDTYNESEQRNDDFLVNSIEFKKLIKKLGGK